MKNKSSYNVIQRDVTGETNPKRWTLMTYVILVYINNRIKRIEINIACFYLKSLYGWPLPMS